ncbi:hypothetical protein FM120_11405 [Sphingobacterium faecium PCAi_F2.5]|nr:hypothetical protein FM120_11405 [Sphingobacterium faecium PCAi_F2.5]
MINMINPARKVALKNFRDDVYEKNIQYGRTCTAYAVEFRSIF